MIYVVPGNPALAIAGDRASEELMERIRQELGLNDPLPVQYGRYMGKLLQGDLGDSYVYRTPVTTAVLERLASTFQLAVVAIVLRVLAGLAVGFASAKNRRGGHRSRFHVRRRARPLRPELLASHLILLYVLA